MNRLVVNSLPVASVLTIGLGKRRDEWPADVIRRAAGSAARALGGAEAAVTTLGELPGAGVLEAAVEGLILGSYRFTAFRTDKTAPKARVCASHGVVHSQGRQNAGRSCSGGRDRRRHRP